MVSTLAKKQIKVLLLFLFLLFSVLPSFLAIDLFGLENGYSVAWLIVCYIFGACLKKYDLHIFKKYEWIIIAFSSICVFVIKFTLYFILHKNMDYFMSYFSPFILLNAIMLLQWATNQRKSEKRINGAWLYFLSKITFDVYILHSHVLIFQVLIADNFSWIANINEWLIIPAIVISSVLIFLICSPLAAIKQRLFKIKRIDKMFSFVGNKLDFLLS